jgi:isoquinoline 1-oxidoreductase beta subunit
LIGAGVVTGSLALGVVVGLPRLRLGIADAFDGGAGGGPPGNIPKEATLWFEIAPDNRVVMYSPKIEMGQGIHTALGQIAAEELEIAWEQLEVRQASTAVGPYDAGGTSGSNSVASLYTPLRETAATMREMLRTEAARQLQVAPSALLLKDGVFTVSSDSSKSLTYGQVVQAVTTWEVPENPPPLKTSDQFRYIGQPMPRVDFQAKLTGQAIYGYDMRLPGMKYGAVARPPTFSAQLRQVAPGQAAEQPGVVKVVAERDFAGVVADSRLQAQAAVAQLALEWDTGRAWQQADIEALISVGQGTGVSVQEVGDAAGQLRSGSPISAEYRTPLAAHAHLEAQAALADVQADRVRIWVSAQFTEMARTEVAKVLGRRPETVEVTPTFLGGGFGRKSGVEPAVEAARLSAAAGVPVHVGWTRPEDMRDGYVRPPTHHILRATLNGDKIQAIEHQQASGHVAFGFVPAIFEAVVGADFGAWRGARIPYGAEHIHTKAWHNDLPMRTGWWRGLGLMANVFATESFIDELAVSAQVDPLAFRLANLPQTELGARFRKVLETVAERSGWQTPAPNGRARGLACCVDAGTVVAQVAEVSVEAGKIRVHRFTAAVDPGLIINPDGVIAQTQGSIVMGLSSTLLEELTVRDGAYEQANFDSYPILTIKETPQIEVALLQSGERPFGMGEPPLGPVAAAVANAVFALNGQRLRRLPLRLG